MVKKFLTLVMTAAVAASLCLVPASAATLEDCLVLNVDFSTGNWKDSSPSACMVEKADGGDITFETDEELGKTVARFQEACLQYTLKDYGEVTSNFTIEAYVNVAKQSGFALICGTYWFNTRSGAGISCGSFTDSASGQTIGFRRGLSSLSGTGSDTITVYGNKDTSFDQWVHLVYVHEGNMEYFYMNGTPIAANGTDSTDPLPQNEGEGFRIGAYNKAHNFDVKDMKASFVRVYNTAVTSEEVQSLYADRNGEGGSSNDNNSPEPTTPSDPTPVAPSPTTKPNQTDNAATFDLGLVSLAAVALSSVVAVKRKRK